MSGRVFLRTCEWRLKTDFRAEGASEADAAVAQVIAGQIGRLQGESHQASSSAAARRPPGRAEGYAGLSD